MKRVSLARYQFIACPVSTYSIKFFTHPPSVDISGSRYVQALQALASVYYSFGEMAGVDPPVCGAEE